MHMQVDRLVSKLNDVPISLNEFFNRLEIPLFKLNNYKAHPAISAEMIAPK